MALGDDAIVPCFTLLTDTPLSEIEEMKKKMVGGENPMVFKKQLAFELTKQFNSAEAAQTAQKEFEIRFQEGSLAKASLPTVPISALSSLTSLAAILVDTKIAESRSKAKQLLAQGAVYWNGNLMTADALTEKPTAGDIIKAGRKAVKLV